MQKRILPSALLALCSVFSVSANALTATPPAVAGEISSLAELKWLSEHQEEWAKNWTLTKDIDANDTMKWNVHPVSGKPEGFMPIGYKSADPATAFTGTFDGGNHKITGLTTTRYDNAALATPCVDAAAGLHVGLFGYIFGGEVKNLTLENSRVIGECSSGALAGHIKNTNIQNVKVIGEGDPDDGYDSFTSKIYSKTVAGGLVGESEGSNLSNVDVTAYVYSPQLVGGVVGALTDSSKLENADASAFLFSVDKSSGGLVGKADTATIKQSKADTVILADDLGYAGGAVAESTDTTYEDVTVITTINAKKSGGVIGLSNSDNLTGLTLTVVATGDELGGVVSTGSDTVVTRSQMSINLDSEVSAGGIAAKCTDCDVSEVAIFNSSKIVGKNNVGGVFGASMKGATGSTVNTVSIGAQVTGDTNAGLLGGNMDSVVASDVVVSGKFSQGVPAPLVDVIAPLSVESTFTNIYFDKEIHEELGATSVHAKGLTTADMMKKASYTGLDFATSWTQGRWVLAGETYPKVSLGYLPVFTYPAQDEGGLGSVVFDEGDAIDIQVLAQDSSPYDFPVKYKMVVKKTANSPLVIPCGNDGGVTPPVTDPEEELVVREGFITIDQESGHITGTSIEEDAGDYEITVYARVGGSENALPPFKLTVSKYIPEADCEKNGGAFGGLALALLGGFAFFRRRK